MVNNKNRDVTVALRIEIVCSFIIEVVIIKQGNIGGLIGVQVR